MKKFLFFLALLLGHSAQAAVTLVSGQTFTEVADHWGASTSSGAKDLPVAATTGNLIVVAIVYFDGAGTQNVTGIDDAGTTTFSLARQTKNTSVGLVVEIWSGIAAGTNSGQDVVVTVQSIASSANHFIGLVEFAGNDADQSSLSVNGANTASVTSHDSGSVTPGVADNVIIGMSSGSNRTWTNDADFTNVLVNGRTVFSYKIQSANTAQSFTVTSDTNAFAGLAIVAFKGAAGGGGPVFPTTLQNLGKAVGPHKSQELGGHLEGQ